MFVSDPTGWFEDPTQILAIWKGICAQWSEVYASACLALSYQSRLVAAVDTGNWSCIHIWAQDYYNGTWVAWTLPTESGAILQDIKVGIGAVESGQMLKFTLSKTSLTKM